MKLIAAYTGSYWLIVADASLLLVAEGICGQKRNTNLMELGVVRVVIKAGEAKEEWWGSEKREGPRSCWR